MDVPDPRTVKRIFSAMPLILSVFGVAFVGEEAWLQFLAFLGDV